MPHTGRRTATFGPAAGGGNERRGGRQRRTATSVEATCASRLNAHTAAIAASNTRSAPLVAGRAAPEARAAGSIGRMETRDNAHAFGTAAASMGGVLAAGFLRVRHESAKATIAP